MSNKLSFIAIIPATLLFYANLATTNLALAVDTETGTNVSFSFIVFTSRSRDWDYRNNRTVVKKYLPKGMRSACKGDDSNSASENEWGELTNCNWRSCQLKEIGWGKPRHLWLLSHLQLRRVLICLDADDQVDIHKAEVPVCWSCSSDICPSTHSISSYPLYPLLETMENATMVQVIRVLGECRIVPSPPLISDLILFSHRIHWGAQGSISTTACRQVLWQGG